MEFDYPSTDAATLTRDSNDVLLIQQNHRASAYALGPLSQRVVNLDFEISDATRSSTIDC